MSMKPFHESDFSTFQRYLKSEGFPEFKQLPKKITHTDHGARRPNEYKIIEQWLLPRSDIAQSGIFYVIQRFDTGKGYGNRIRVAYYRIEEEGKFKGTWRYRRSCPWYTRKDLVEIVPLLEKLRHK